VVIRNDIAAFMTRHTLTRRVFVQIVMSSLFLTIISSYSCSTDIGSRNSETNLLDQSMVDSKAVGSESGRIWSFSTTAFSLSPGPNQPITTEFCLTRISVSDSRSNVRWLTIR
jgi:hypothetical protein